MVFVKVIKAELNLDAKLPIDVWVIPEKRKEEIKERVLEIWETSKSYADAIRRIMAEFSDTEALFALALFEFSRGVQVANEFITLTEMGGDA